MKIDFVSDIACPWCAIGLNSLERALENMNGAIPVELHFHPFELNPDMDSSGADPSDYLAKKYGMSKEQIAQGRLDLRARGAAVGFQFGDATWVWNTFDAHRLLYWAGLQSPTLQRRLKHVLLNSYHGSGRNSGDVAVLLELCTEAGLDPAEAHSVIHSDRYAAEVRAEERQWQSAGIRSVPSIIINDKHLVTGGQPPEIFEQILRKIASQPDTRSDQ